MTENELGKDLLQNLGGIDQNDLNNIVKILSMDEIINEDHQETFLTSNYYDLDSLSKSLQNKSSSLSVLSLNIEGLHAKFDKLTAFLQSLANKNLEFSVIMLQVTWLAYGDNVHIFNIPGYNLVNHRYQCGKREV